MDFTKTGSALKTLTLGLDANPEIKLDSLKEEIFIALANVFTNGNLETFKIYQDEFLSYAEYDLYDFQYANDEGQHALKKDSFIKSKIWDNFVTWIKETYYQDLDSSINLNTPIYSTQLEKISEEIDINFIKKEFNLVDLTLGLNTDNYGSILFDLNFFSVNDVDEDELINYIMNLIIESETGMNMYDIHTAQEEGINSPEELEYYKAAVKQCGYEEDSKEELAELINY